MKSLGTPVLDCYHIFCANCLRGRANNRLLYCPLCGLQSPLPMSCPSPSLNDMPLGRKPPSHRYICTKVLLAEGRESPFTEHCRNFEKSYRVLHTEVQKLKDEVQELHRDLTKHHSLINTDTMNDILERSLLIDEQIASQYSAVQTQRAVFEEIWDVTFQRVTNEQEIYEAIRRVPLQCMTQAQTDVLSCSLMGCLKTSSDSCRQGEQRNISETSCCKDLPL
ncbi:RING finger protein 207 isoform X9 [Paramisgurnus dabryanus]|uniref:RING finger protein 207 isoform X9 n=1 Tax=Paramisgurnus dabryanus TaxID=90735 RepID=UPI003CCF6967